MVLKVIGIILIVIAGLYIVFSFGPSIVSFGMLFAPKKCVPYQDRPNIKETYIGPFLDQVIEGYAFFEKLNKEEWSITSYDGYRLTGEYYGQKSSKTAVLVHGYASSAMNSFCILGQDLYRMGYNVLMIHQRAHTGSEGKHTTFGGREKTDVLDWVKKVASDESVEEILLGGVSTGASTVGLASSKVRDYKVRALIFDCGFTDAYHQLRDGCNNRSIPWIMMMPLLRLWGKLFLHVDILKESALEALKENTIPTLFIHGTEDDTVAFHHGKECYEACAAPKMKIFLEGGNHASTYLFGQENSKRILKEFLDKYM